MAVRIGPTIGIEGEKVFRAQLRECMQAAKTLDAQMEHMTATFSRNDTALQRNTRVSQSLTKQIEEQKKAVEQAEKMRERASAAEERANERYANQINTVQRLYDKYERASEAVAELASEYGIEDARTQGAIHAQQELEKQFNNSTKELEKAEIAVHRQREVTENWTEKTYQAKTALEQLERELLKTPNYLEEFQRNTEGSQKNLERLERSVELTGKQLQLTQTKYTSFTSELKKNADMQTYLKDKLEAQKRVLEQTTQLRKQAGQVVYNEERSLYSLSKKLDEAKIKYGENSKEARLLTDAVAEQKKRVDETVDTYNNFIDKEKDAKIAIGETTQELEKQKNAFMIVGETTMELGESISSLGEKLTQKLTVPLVGAATASVKFASDFRDGMAKVYTIADETAVPMETMADGLKRLSDESGFGLDDLAEAAYQAVSASVKTEDAVDFLTEATKLARAGFTDTTTAVDILSTVMNTYGHEAYSAAEISDILLKTQNDGKTIVDQLANRMGIIIPMAKNYGVSLEQIAAGYATMTKQGVKTEMATTYFRAMFTELEKEGSDVSDLLETLTGKTFKQLMDSGWDIADVLKLLWNHVDGNSEAFQRLFGNVRSTQAVAALAADDFGILEDELDAMQNTTGLVDEALETLQTPGLQARKTINRLKNASEEFGEDLLNDLLPVLDKVVGWVEKWTKAYRDADKPTRNMVKNVVAVAAALGPGVFAIGKTVTAVGAVIKGFGAFSKLLTTGAIPGVTGLSAALGVLAPAVVAVGAALGGMWVAYQYGQEQYQQYIEKTYGLSDAQKEILESSKQTTDGLHELRDASKENAQATVENYEACGPLVEKYRELLDSEGNVKEGANGLADLYLGKLAEALGMTKEDIRDLITGNSELETSIEAVIEAEKNRALLEAYEDEYIQSLKDRAKLEKDLALLQENASSAEKYRISLENELKQVRDEYLSQTNLTEKETAEYQARMNELGDALKLARDKEWDFKNQLGETQAALAYSDNLAVNYERAVQAIADGSADAGTAIQMLTTDFKNSGSATYDELRQQKDYYDKFYDDLEQAVKEGRAGVTEADLKEAEKWRELANKEYEKAALDAQKGAEKTSQKEAAGYNKYMTQAQQNAAQQKVMAMNGYDDKGQAGRTASRESKDYADGVDDYKWTANSNAGSVVDAAISGLADGGRAYARGEDFGLGYASGLTARAVINGVISGASSLVNLANNTIASKQQSGSPSKVAAERGEEFGEGYALGIDNTSSLVSSAANGLVNSALMDSMMMDNMTSYGGWASARTVNAPINVNVNVNGNVDDYGELADVIADRINTQVLQKQGAF